MPLRPNGGHHRAALHSFQRTVAIGVLRNGADLLKLQRLTGHSGLTLPYHYAKQTNDDLREVHTRTSPADRP